MAIQGLRDIISLIVTSKGDKKSDDWKKACQSLEQSGQLKDKGKYTTETLEPIFNSDRKNTEEIRLTFLGLEKAFFSLYIYAANLCGDDKIGDYSILKTYTGYYTVNVASSLSIHKEILRQMGYREKEYDDVFEIGVRVTQNIEQIAFDLFHAHLYCKRMREIMTEVKKYSSEVSVAKKIFERSHEDEFVIEEVGNYCDRIHQQQLRDQIRRQQLPSNEYQQPTPQPQTPQPQTQPQPPQPRPRRDLQNLTLPSENADEYGDNDENLYCAPDSGTSSVEFPNIYNNPPQNQQRQENYSVKFPPSLSTHLSNNEHVGHPVTVQPGSNSMQQMHCPQIHNSSPQNSLPYPPRETNTMPVPNATQRITLYESNNSVQPPDTTGLPQNPPAYTTSNTNES